MFDYEQESFWGGVFITFVISVIVILIIYVTMSLAKDDLASVLCKQHGYASGTYDNTYDLIICYEENGLGGIELFGEAG